MVYLEIFLAASKLSRESKEFGDRSVLEQLIDYKGVKFLLLSVWFHIVLYS